MVKKPGGPGFENVPPAENKWGFENPRGPVSASRQNAPRPARMEESTLRFNVLEHKLVPEHRVLTDKESEEVLKVLRVTKDQLPKIRREDPAVQVLEKARKAPIPEGTIIKVTRLSETAGVSEAYRLVVGR